MKEKKEFDEHQNPEEYWNEVIKVNRINLKGEKQNIEKYEKGREMLSLNIKETEEGLNLDMEETDLIRQLYPEHGKEYENTDLFKEFFNKKLKFILKNINNKIKGARDQFVFQMKASQSSIDQAKEQIKVYKSNINKAKQKQKEAIKDKKKMFG